MKSARYPVRKNQPVVGFDLLTFFRTMAMRGVLVAALGAAGGSTAEAVNRIWVGGTSSNWGSPANWSGGQLPFPADTEIFGSSGSRATVDLGIAGRIAGGLTFNSTVGTTITSLSQTLTLGTTLTDCFVNVVGNSHTINAAVTGTGDIRLQGAGNLTFGNAVTAAAIAIGSLENGFNPSYSGTVTFNGTVTTEGLIVGDTTYNSLSPCTLVVGGNITNNLGYTILASGITVRAATGSHRIDDFVGGTYISNVTFDGPGDLSISNAFLDNPETAPPAQITYTMNGTGKVTFEGLDGWQPGMGLIKAGIGTMEIKGAGGVDYTGNTRVNGGTLALADVTALQNSTLDKSGAGSITFTVVGNQTYQLGGLKGSGLLNAGANSLRVGANGESTVSTGGITAAALTKEGAGTLTLTGPQNYATLTTDAGAGATIVNSAIGTGTTAVVANGDIRFGTVSQKLASLTIGAGAKVTFTSGVASLTGEGGKSAGFGVAAVVPEPGAFVLLLVGALGLVTARRRPAGLR